MSGLEHSSVDHIEDAAGCPRNNVDSVFETENVIADALAADEGVHVDLDEVAQRQDHLLRLLCQLASGREDEHLWLTEGEGDILEGAHREDARFTGSALALDDDIAALDNGHDGALLDSGGLHEAVVVDAA